MKSRGYRTRLLAGAILAVAMAAPAYGQDDASKAPPPPKPAPYQPSTQLETVTTTARKQEETLIDVPVAVSALTANDMARYRSDSLSQIGDMVPQVQITPGSSGNGGTIAIRGITSTSIDPGIESAVSINIDGVQVSRGYIAAAGFLDLQQVEVLKGPQALFFGKNSPAGVISLRSKNPGDTWEGYIKAGYEFRAAERYVEAAYGGPINDKVGVRVAGRFDDMDGWLRNLAGPLANPFEPNHPYPGATNNKKTPARHNIMGRLTLELKPTDDFHAVLKILGNSYKDNDLTGGQQIIQCPYGMDHPTTRGIVDPYEDCKKDRYRSVGGLPTDIRENYPLAKKNKDFFTDRTMWLGSLDMSYDIGDININSVTGFFHLDTNGLGNYAYTTIDYFPGINGEKSTSWTQEVRITSHYDAPVNFVLGGFFESTKRRSFTVGRGGILNTIPPDPNVNFDVGYWPNDTSDRTTWSGFGQLLWDIVDNLQLTAGVRYSSEKIDFVNENIYTNPAFPSFILRAPGNPLTGTVDESNWSPEATLTWHPTANQTLYAAYKTGYKSGGVSQTAILLASNTVDSLSFGPETARGGEIGYKALLDDGRLRTSAAAYYYMFNGLQRSALDIPTTSFLTRNAAKAVSQGFEVEAVYQATEYLQLRTALTYNDAHYKSFTNAPCYNGQLIIEGADTTCNAATGTVDLSGRPVALAPKFVGTIGGSYDIPASDWLWITLTGDVKYSSGYWAQDQEPPGSRQKHYAQINTSIRFHDPEDKWEFAVIGRNLTNRMIIGYSGDTPGGGPGQLTGTLSRGREISVQATARF
ncbi:MAG: TonB-dependent receptor plug domain-containing protein [Alphaproteobacteria bacterium]|nr:TonB-dependent receptor plug domain-containing protein [Alphaproteobacteria bacterium]